MTQSWPYTLISWRKDSAFLGEPEAPQPYYTTYSLVLPTWTPATCLSQLLVTSLSLLSQPVGVLDWSLTALMLPLPPPLCTHPLAETSLVLTFFLLTPCPHQLPISWNVDTLVNPGPA